MSAGFVNSGPVEPYARRAARHCRKDGASSRFAHVEEVGDASTPRAITYALQPGLVHFDLNFLGQDDLASAATISLRELSILCFNLSHNKNLRLLPQVSQLHLLCKPQQGGAVYTEAPCSEGF